MLTLESQNETEEDKVKYKTKLSVLCESISLLAMFCKSVCVCLCVCVFSFYLKNKLGIISTASPGSSGKKTSDKNKNGISVKHKIFVCVYISACAPIDN